MANVKPFCGLRYNTEKVGSLSFVTAPPYDIISESEQEALVARHENNIISLELGKIFETDNENNNRYTRARDCLNNWMNSEVLKFDETPAYYIYEEIFEIFGTTKHLRGIISAVELVPFSEKIVLPHEETLSKAKADRFNLMSETHANFSPIYFLYMDEKKTVNQIMEEICKLPPAESFKTDDGIIHNMWIVDDKETCDIIEASFKDKQLFIADGHHRYETALKFSHTLPENEGARHILAFSVEMDDPGLVVLPTHRIVKDLESFDEEVVISQLNAYFDVRKVYAENVGATAEKLLAENITETSFAFYTGKDYFYLITLENKKVMNELLPEKSAAYCELDVSVLHTLILDKIFSIDMENMANQKNLLYTKFSSEAIETVKQSGADCAFLLNGTKIHQIKDVSLNNEKMPQKSTYFYPKLITGLVINKF